jgi:hypothetical protein
MNLSSEIVLPVDQAHTIFRLSAGVVSDICEGHFVVVEAKPCNALRAASCLAEPQVGDTVLFARGDDAYWIVAVLVAAGYRDLHLQAPTLCAKADHLSLSASTLHTSSQRWQAVHTDIHLAANHLTGQISVVDWLSERVSTFVNFLFNRSRNSVREVSEIDTTRCGNFDLKVNETLAMSAKTGVISGQALMKIDATQIHIG